MQRIVIFILLLLLSTISPSRADDSPFPHFWSGYATSLKGCSPEQRHNINGAFREALRRLGERDPAAVAVYRFKVEAVSTRD